MYRLRINKLPDYYGLAHKAQYDNTDFILSKISTKHLIFNFLTFEEKNKILKNVLKNDYVNTKINKKHQNLTVEQYISHTIRHSKLRADVISDPSYKIKFFNLKKEFNLLFSQQTIEAIQKKSHNEPNFLKFIQLLLEKEKLVLDLKLTKNRKKVIRKNYHEQLIISEADSKYRREIYNVLRDSLYRTLKILNKVEKQELKKSKIVINPQDTKILINETLKFIFLINKNQKKFFRPETLKKLDALYEMINEQNVRRVFNSLLDIVNEYQYLGEIPEIQLQINLLKNITPIGAAIFSNSFKYLTSFIEEEILKNEKYIKETKENLAYTSNKIYNKLLKETSKGISSIYEADLMNLKYESTIINEISVALDSYKQQLLIVKNIHNKSNVRDYNKTTNEFFNWFKNIILSLNTWTIRNEKNRAKWVNLVDYKNELFNNKILENKIAELDLQLNTKINLQRKQKYQRIFQKEYAKNKQEFIKKYKQGRKNAIILYADKYKLDVLKLKCNYASKVQREIFSLELKARIESIFIQEKLRSLMKDIPFEDKFFVNVFINGIMEKKQIIDLERINAPIHVFKLIAKEISDLEKIISTRIILMSSSYIPTNDKNSLLISSFDNIPVEIASSKTFNKKPAYCNTKLQFEKLMELSDRAINSKIIFRDQIYITPKYNFVKYIEIYKKHFVLTKEKDIKKTKRNNIYEIK